jgi:hypothetical protein
MRRGGRTVWCTASVKGTSVIIWWSRFPARAGSGRRGMAVRIVGVVLGAAGLVMGLTGPVLAKTLPPPIVVAHAPVASAPRMLIDSMGTENVVWTSISKQTDSYGDHYYSVRYARKPKGAKSFSQVELKGVFDPETPLLYQISPGVLQILVDGSASSGGQEGTFAWRSTDDGKSWTVINGSALSTADLHNQGIYIYEQSMVVAPGGPITYAGSDGSSGPIVQVKNDLSGYTMIGTIDASLANGRTQLARSTSGAIFVATLGTTASSVAYQAGSKVGQISFPSCTSPDISFSLAAGRSGAVLAATDCGRSWVRTISPAGKLGKLVTLGNAPADSAWVSATAASNGHFTVAWVESSGDLGVSRSSSGSTWKASRGAVPIAEDGAGGTISAGAQSWYLFQAGSDPSYQDVGSQVRAIPLSETYLSPKPPSAAGIHAPRRGHLGSLAGTAPGKVALKHWRSTGKVIVRVIDALSTKVTVGVSDTRVKKGTTYDICSGGKTVKLAANTPKTVALTCSSGAIVIGGTAGTGIDAHKGDLVQFSFAGRGTSFNLKGRVS